MSALQSTVSSPESIYCDISENQWNQEISPNIPQTVTESDLYELSDQNLIPLRSNAPPPSYQAPNGLSHNGVNGVSYVQHNLNGPSDRNGANLPNVINGMRTLNIPNGLNGTSVMIRPNGNGINMINGVNGYMNAAANQRFQPRPTWITPTKTINGVKKQKRNRTAFTSQQMMELEQEYARTRYLDRTRRIELSEILHLNERTIKIWFQNRRMKEKKDRAESLEDSEEVSTTEHSPEMGMTGAVPMPVLIHEQYPTTVTNDVYNRAMYVDYQMPSNPTSVSAVPQVLQNPMSEYAEYISTEAYEAQSRQVHTQLQHCVPMYSNELEAVHANSSTSQPDSCSPAEPSIAPGENWDLSWIRSMQTDDEF